MANFYGYLPVDFNGISPKSDSATGSTTFSQEDLTTMFPAIGNLAYVIVGNNLIQRQVEVVEKLRKCLDRLRQTALATGGTNNYTAKMNINASSGQVQLFLDAAVTFTEDEVAVGYGPMYFPANRAGLSGYLVPGVNLLIDTFQERQLKDKENLA